MNFRSFSAISLLSNSFFFSGFSFYYVSSLYAYHKRSAIFPGRFVLTNLSLPIWTYNDGG